MKYGNRSPWKMVMSSPVTLVIALLAFIFMARAAWNVHQRSAASADRLAQAQASLADLEAHKQDVSQKVAYISTDQGVESEIRTKFRLTREGESVAVIVDDSKPASSVSQASSTPPAPSLWQKILRLFGF